MSLRLIAQIKALEARVAELERKLSDLTAEKTKRGTLRMREAANG